jgi:hypothetical protein
MLAATAPFTERNMQMAMMLDQDLLPKQDSRGMIGSTPPLVACVKIAAKTT